ncbi:MAG TPA: NAD-dependent epimerase/dehydratase family protein [Thermoanaerobaculia bacterium]|nr:NAD-dependent epimerase/dehydratase family protein [Thermoanaerobaculia bacterium]
MSRRVLVTGGAGFIASHIVDAYVERGFEVTVIDDLSSGSRENVNRKAELVAADINSKQAIEIIRKGKFDLINHHAAQIDVRVSVKDPALDAETNVVGSLRLAQAAVENGVKKVIFASSGGAAYGEPITAPQDESHPTNPISPYGCAKLAFDYYLGFFRAVHGLNTVSLRYGNVYGPRQRKDGEAGVVAIFGGKLFDGEPAVINGTGEQTRDYIFVGDVVRANMAVSEQDLSGIFNVGTGVETSVTELWDALQKAAEIEGQASHAPAKPGEQMRSILDGTKLRRAAGLPDPVALDEGLPITMEWLREKR